MAHQHAHTSPGSRYRVSPVSRTEDGTERIESMFERLRRTDESPLVEPDKHDPKGVNSNAMKLSNLRQQMETSSLSSAVRKLQEHEYFRADLGESPILLIQLRNRLPSDASVVWRNGVGSLPVSRILGVALTDPTAHLDVSPKLLPATRPRGPGDLQRRVFALHEVFDEEWLLKSDVFRSIYRAMNSSWFGIVVGRDAEFSWSLYIWHEIRVRDDVERLRAGLELVAEALAECACRMIALGDTHTQASLVDVDSLQIGRLVLSDDFKEVRLQNHTAENIMRRLRNACDRRDFYETLRTEYDAHQGDGPRASWELDQYGLKAENGIIRVDIEPIDAGILIRLRELQPAPLQQITLLQLPEDATHTPSGVISEVRRKRQPFYVPQFECIVRPVWESDLIASRLYQCPVIPATEFSEVYAKGRFRSTPQVAISFRSEIVAVAHGL
jgi:hypothetical protein